MPPQSGSRRSRRGSRTSWVERDQIGVLVTGEDEVRSVRHPGELEPEVPVAFLGEVRPRLGQTRRRLEVEDVPLVELVTLDALERVAKLVLVDAELGHDAVAAMSGLLLGLPDRASLG